MKRLLCVVGVVAWMTACSGGEVDDVGAGEVTAADDAAAGGSDSGTRTLPGTDATSAFDTSAPPDTTVAPDATAPPDTTAGEDTELPAGPCDDGVGCFGDPCADELDCYSGLCVEHMGSSVCTETCDGDCPPGWACTQAAMGGGDPVFLCVSTFEHLCRPCIDSDDCVSDTSEAVCVTYAGEGSFCGASCTEDAECPEGFACQESVSTRGGASAQCVNLSGVCECSATAAALGLATACEVGNDQGTCGGLRTCSQDGLGACDAATPAMEVCNGVDDDCDGETDEATCDDGNPCTDDLCDGETGCSYPLIDGTPCDDDDVCSTADQCADGVCIGEPVVCQDGNPCTDDLCDALLGCRFDANTLPCDDGETCTLEDQCAEGECVPGFQVQCDDGNPCTTDLCSAEVGCEHVANDAVCDDANACTEGDTCDGGACVGGAAVECDDGQLCTTDSCDPTAGCLHTANTAPCSDEDVCTLGDQCADGVCAPGGQGFDCDDQNPCTDDSCHPTDGCIYAANDAGCDDLNSCTTGDHCAGGVCVGEGSLACDDLNPCTEDSCLPGGGCDHQPIEGACSDGDPCTVGDLCALGACVAGAEADCDDQNPCTEDACGDAGQCVHEPTDGACDDQNPCTIGDTCLAGGCAPTAAFDCDDDNLCTTDACDPLTGCVNTPNTQPCTDDDACTLVDLCEAGGCVGSVPMPCDDQNPCTDDSCDPAQGCDYAANTDPCDDQNACTTIDQCTGGACVGSVALDCSDGEVCTADLCHPGSGCDNPPTAGGCSDGDICTLNDLCDGGVCEGTSVLTCDDGNPCTDDTCDPIGGCVFTPNTADCNDGDACTTGDVCSEGTCHGPGTLACGDTLYCNGDEVCDPATGCTQGPPPSLDDGIACTLDTCDEDADTSVHTPIDEDCDDDLFCNGAEVCNPDVGCVTGALPKVSDGVDCTVDSCSDELGTVEHTPDDDACPAAGLCETVTCDLTDGCVTTPTPNCCGNGVTEDGEACDDQNTDPSDGCLSTCQRPATCKDIHDVAPSVADGVYTLFPTGGQPAFKAWCDMAGGGWTLSSAWSSGWPPETFGDFNSAGDDPSPTKQHAIPFKQMPIPSEYRVTYLGNGETFSGSVNGTWSSDGRSTRIQLTDGRHLVYDGEYCGSNAGFCAVNATYNDQHNCDGNSGQLASGGQGLFVQCAGDEWCSCGDRGWKVNANTCQPSVCPISANVVVYLR